MKPVLLLVDDEKSVLRSLKRALRHSDFEIVTADSGVDALPLLNQYEVGVIISDLNMPQMTGIEFLSEAKKLSPNTVRMVLSGFADLQMVTDSINCGNVYKFLTKPWNQEVLSAAIEDGFLFYQRSVAANQFNTVYQHTLEGVLIINRQGKVESVNAAVLAMLAYAESEILGKDIELLQTNRHNTEFYTDIWRTLTVEGKWQGEIWVRSKSGEECCHWVNICTLENNFGDISKYVAVFIDLGEIKKQQEKLRYQALHDELTGLANRRLFENHLDLSVKKATRCGESFAVMFLDLDKFKPINDNFGHAVGDRILCLFSDRLKKAVRESDLIARVGGDEFCILLSVLAREEDAQVVANKIHKIMVSPFDIDGHLFDVSVSIGISTFPGDSQCPQSLLKKADAKMYSAKHRSTV